MEPTEAKVIWYVNIPPGSFKVDGKFLDLLLPEGRIQLFMDTTGIDPDKPLRLTLCQP